jgi:lysophospholipase L1-like esterase
VDNNRLWEGRPGPSAWLLDGCHPDAEGQEAIAGALLPVVSKTLGKD